jgi:5-methylcytosine-specific restriction enzyme subunit McrC
MIKIDNLYYLLSYAWDHLEELDNCPVGEGGTAPTLNLLARMLLFGTRRALRRGLHREYVAREGALPGVRGKLQPTPTLRHRLLDLGKTYCQWDEYEFDNPDNQILIAALYLLLRHDALDKQTEAGIRRLLARMPRMTIVPLTPRLFAERTYHRGKKHYRFLHQVCQLIHENSLPQENGEGRIFRDFTRSEREMNHLFEGFLRNFYAHHLDDHSVGAPHIKWQFTADNPDHLRLLPTMRTDVTITGPSGKTIIDAKYYRKSLNTYYDKESVISTNLYQLFSYLKQQDDPQARGMLIYPQTSRPLDLVYRHEGHKIVVRTVNLEAGWELIEARLIGIFTGREDQSRLLKTTI